jgi:hypothetical protein
MSDNKKKTGEPDRSRISTKEKYEMDYWKKELNVSSQQLVGAVRAAGNSASAVREYLKGRK